MAAVPVSPRLTLWFGATTLSQIHAMLAFLLCTAEWTSGAAYLNPLLQLNNHTKKESL